MHNTAAFYSIQENIVILVAHVPNLNLTIWPWFDTPIREFFSIAVEWDTHIRLANQYLSDPSTAPSSQIIDLLNEYKEVREKSSWDNLSDELKVRAWKENLYSDLNKIKMGTARHITKLGLN